MNQLYDVPDFTGYKADKKGNIYSVIPKGCRNRFDETKWTTPKKLKQRKTKTGYCRVYMRRDSTNIREDVYVHRIIMIKDNFVQKIIKINNNNKYGIVYSLQNIRKLRV